MEGMKKTSGKKRRELDEATEQEVVEKTVSILIARLGLSAKCKIPLKLALLAVVA